MRLSPLGANIGKLWGLLIIQRRIKRKRGLQGRKIGIRRAEKDTADMDTLHLRKLKLISIEHGKDLSIVKVVIRLRRCLPQLSRHAPTVWIFPVRIRRFPSTTARNPNLT
jgi:predicted DCC family thiol-disulfide oxidoreductase YuxK